MMLDEVNQVADAVLPVDEFKAHLRLGTGFGEDNLQDAVLISFLRASIAAVEARIGKVVLQRRFAWEAADWTDRAGQVLPVAPVVSVESVTRIAAGGSEETVPDSEYLLRRDVHAPSLLPVGALLPQIAQKGAVRVVFDAGMSADWAGVPSDLAQAVLLLAAHYYEYRNEVALGEGCMPFGVSSLLQRYRRMRISIGAGQ